jgi:hypothetical protein
MVIGDVTYDLQCLITNTRDKCLTKYDNHMVIGGRKSHHLSPCN